MLSACRLDRSRDLFYTSSMTCHGPRAVPHWLHDPPATMTCSKDWSHDCSYTALVVIDRLPRRQSPTLWSIVDDRTPRSKPQVDVCRWSAEDPWRTRTPYGGDAGGPFWRKATTRVTDMGRRMLTHWQIEQIFFSQFWPLLAQTSDARDKSSEEKLSRSCMIRASR
jgi:hypothetical protein